MVSSALASATLAKASVSAGPLRPSSTVAARVWKTLSSGLPPTPSLPPSTSHTDCRQCHPRLWPYLLLNGNPSVSPLVSIQPFLGTQCQALSVSGCCGLSRVLSWACSLLAFSPLLGQQHGRLAFLAPSLALTGHVCTLSLAEVSGPFILALVGLEKQSNYLCFCHWTSPSLASCLL